MEPNTKQYREVTDEVKEIDEGERSIVHFISTENPDRMGDVVKASGMDDEAFSKNPTVLYAHNYGGFPIGKSLWRKKAQRNHVKGILAKTQFAPTEEGIQAFELWKFGALNASSIGFMPMEYEPLTSEDGKMTGYEIRKWELLEYSIVPVPANGEALRLAMEKGVVTEPKFQKAIGEMILEKRVCELEECRKGMESFPAEFQALIERIKMLEEKTWATPEQLQELSANLLSQLEALKPQIAEKAAGISTEDLTKITAEVVRGAFSRMRGRV